MSAVLLAFCVFESVKHGGGVAAAVAVGLIAPDLALRAAKPFNALHHPMPPIVVMVVSAFLPFGTVPFVLAAAWFTHLAIHRAFGLGRR